MKSKYIYLYCLPIFLYFINSASSQPITLRSSDLVFRNCNLELIDSLSSSFQWPRNNAYIYNNDYSNPSGSGNRRHTGIDIHETSNLLNGPLFAVSNGVVVGIFKPIQGDSGYVNAYTNYPYPHFDSPEMRVFDGERIRDHNMQGVVIIRHNLPIGGSIYNGGTIYSLYAHLGSVHSSIVINKIINRGDTVGWTGGGGNKHVHLEIKNAPYRHDPLRNWPGTTGRIPYWGYTPPTPDNPNNYGFWDPWIFIHQIDSIKPTMGGANTNVTFFGNNFEDLTDSNNCKLKFGDSSAHIISFSNEQIEVTAPSNIGPKLVHVSLIPTKYYHQKYLPTGVRKWTTFSYIISKTKVLADGDDFIHGFLYHDGYIWASTRTAPARILKINPNTLDYEKIILSDGLDFAEDLIFANGYIWTTIMTDPAKIVRVNPSTLDWEVVINFSSDELTYAQSIVYVYGFLWVGGNNKTLAKINLTNYTYHIYKYANIDNEPSFHSLTSGGDFLWGSLIHSNIFGVYASTIMKIDPNNPSNFNSIYFDGYPMADDMILLNDYLYTGTYTSPSQVFKISQSLTYSYKILIIYVMVFLQIAEIFIVLVQVIQVP